MSIGSILNTANQALSAQQLAIETAGNNIANANVDGYSRQRVDMQSNVPLNMQYGQVGTGVTVTNVARIRDTLLDGTYRTQASMANGYSTRANLVSQISNMFGEPSDNGLAQKLDQFWSAWGDLANNPNNTAAKSVVQQRGTAVALTLNSYATQLDQLAATTREQIDNQINDINRYTTQIAAINEQIVAAEAGGKSAPSLRDTRDQLIDKLSQMVPVRTVEHTNGSTTVYVGNSTVVDAASAKQFSVAMNGTTLTLKLEGQPSPVQNISGSLGAMLDVLNTDIPATHQQLDTLAQQLVSTVNTVHRTGWTAAGDALGGANWDASAPPTGSNVDFFDPAGVTAARITLSSQVAGNAAYIAAGNVQNGTGNNAVANQLTQFASDTSTIVKYGSATETTSLGEFYRDLVTRVGVASDDANSSYTVHSTLAQQADLRRTSVSGVSTDEELISLTKFQQAYSAAAKVITVADDMAKTLLDMVR